MILRSGDARFCSVLRPCHRRATIPRPRDRRSRSCAQERRPICSSWPHLTSHPRAAPIGPVTGVICHETPRREAESCRDGGGHERRDPVRPSVPGAAGVDVRRAADHQPRDGNEGHLDAKQRRRHGRRDPEPPARPGEVQRCRDAERQVVAVDHPADGFGLPAANHRPGTQGKAVGRAQDSCLRHRAARTLVAGVQERGIPRTASEVLRFPCCGASRRESVQTAVSRRPRAAMTTVCGKRPGVCGMVLGGVLIDDQLVRRLAVVVGRPLASKLDHALLSALRSWRSPVKRRDDSCGLRERPTRPRTGAGAADGRRRMATAQTALVVGMVRLR
jgi:hypothetical protein